MAAYPNQGAATVTVRLSDVPLQVRVRVANRMIRVEGLEKVDAIDLQIAALNPRQNPAIEVTVEAFEKAVRPWKRKRRPT